MSKQQFKGIVVGAGRMGLTHLAILRTHPNVSIVALCDSSALIGSRLAKQVGVEFSSRFEELIEGESPDFVVIATPTASHHSLAKQALERGVHAFVEKPLALSGEESDDLVAIAEENDVVLSVGYVNRFNDVFLEARRLLSIGALGEIKHVRSIMYGRTVLHDVSGSWRGKASKGGGVLREFGVHGLDLMQFLRASCPTVVAARQLRVHSQEVADATYALMEWKDGAVGQVEINWSDPSYRKPSNLIEVYGDNGRLAVNQHELHVYLRKDVDPRYRSGWTTRYITDLITPVRFYLRGVEFTRQLDNFVAAMEKGSATSGAPGKDAAKIDRLVEAIELTAERNR